MNPRLIIILLVVFVAIHALQAAAAAAAAAVDSATSSDDSIDGLLVRDARGGIDLKCTTQCFKWWQCRVKCLFFCRCNQPTGCDCSKFAWE